MEIIQILGYIGALFIGIVLGLIGGGGSILTVPILVYLLYINPVTATAYSLFIVGSVSSVGTIKNLRNGLVNFKTAITFAIPALLSVFSTRKYLVPAIPDTIFNIGNFILTKDIAIMIFFAIIMVLASVSMIKDRQPVIQKSSENNFLLLIILGFLTGIITGLVGAGGGFIIIPILVLLAGLPMKNAVATSLFIVAVNSLLGFLGDVGHTEIDWKFLLPFSAIAVVGIFIGIWLNKFIDGKKLKKGFGWFVLAMGIYIFVKEVFLK